MITASGAVVIRGPEQRLKRLADEIARAVGDEEFASIGVSLTGRTDGYYLIIGSPDALVEELVALKGTT